MKHVLFALIAATVVSGLAAAYATRVKAQTAPATEIETAAVN